MDFSKKKFKFLIRDSLYFKATDQKLLEQIILPLLSLINNLQRRTSEIIVKFSFQLES